MGIELISKGNQLKATTMKSLVWEQEEVIHRVHYFLCLYYTNIHTYIIYISTEIQIHTLSINSPKNSHL